MRKILLGLWFLLAGLASADAANRFAVCTTTCTWDGASTAMWSTTTGGGTGASVPGSSDAVVIDGATCVGGTTCTITVNTTVNVSSIAMGACTASTTGCVLDFSVNNNSVTTVSFSGTGAGTRTLKMGSGIFTITGVSATIWNFATTTNLTFTTGTSSIVLSGNCTSQCLIQGGGLTYNAIQFGNGRIGTSINGSSTIATLTAVGPTTLSFANGTTTTVTNAFTFTGTSANPISIESASFTAAATISVASGTPSLTWGAVRTMTFSGGATFTATNAFDLGGNTGITITGPSSSGGGFVFGG